MGPTGRFRGAVNVRTCKQSGRSTKLVGAITAAAMTAGVAYLLATGMHLNRAPATDTTMEMVISPPGAPPPPVEEPEPPKANVPPTPPRPRSWLRQIFTSKF